VMSRGWSIVVPEGYVVSRWRVGAPIASGSWASVYEARLAEPEDAHSGRPPGPEVVAVKFLPTGTVTQRQLAVLADMARREQEAYRRLRHPRLVQLFDAVVIEDPQHPELDGAVALVTERARTSLSAVAARAAGEPVADAPRILTEICEGLAYMHSVGWVHGDLKPGNVLVMADGSVRLADFGLAAELDGTHGYLPPAGTCDYQPPERWDEPLTDRGLAVRESADIWALGVLACLLLAGHLPFPGATARARAAAAAEYASSGAPPPLTGELPEQWRQLIADCLAPDHARRSEWTAARLLERLRALQAAPAAASPARRRRRARLAAIAAIPITAAALAGTGTSLWLTAGSPVDYAQYLRAGSGVPATYESLIVQAGTMCHAPGVSPALVAAILKSESDFNPRKSAPVNGFYGIAGWSLSVLPQYTDPGDASHSMRDAMTPSIAIPALGRYLCQVAPGLASVSSDHAVNLAAAYRTTVPLVRDDHGVPPQARSFIAQVRRYLHQYRPAGG
jgi:serine/threonine protein kinase